MKGNFKSTISYFLRTCKEKISTKRYCIIKVVSFAMKGSSLRRERMRMQMMETSISSELMAGEELLWSGRPDPQRKSVVSQARVFLVLGWIYFLLGLALLILGFILLFAFGTSSVGGAILSTMIPGGIFFILGLVFLISAYDVYLTTKSTLYAITNRRAIVVRTGRYLRVISYGKRAIMQVQRFERPDGSGDLVFSGSLFLYSNYSSNSNSAGYNLRRQVAFIGIPNVRAVEQKLLGILAED
jgi:hypothetical protein